MEAPKHCQLACIAHPMRESNYCPKLLFILSGKQLILTLHNRYPMCWEWISFKVVTISCNAKNLNRLAMAYIRFVFNLYNQIDHKKKIGHICYRSRSHMGQNLDMYVVQTKLCCLNVENLNLCYKRKNS